MYLLRSRLFSYKESGYFSKYETLFSNLISASEEFNFKAKDIVRIRIEMRNLLERLSLIYMPWKAEQEQKGVAARRVIELD
jgi:hypothetical protein